MVSINYTLRDENGDVLDSSDQHGQPLSYLHGHGQIIPGLESALDGKSVGESVELMVPPEEAYGPRDPERVVSVPRSKFEFEVSPGEVVEAQHASGQSRNFLVLEVGEDAIILDGNHPLAGKALNFAVEIVAVRDANQEELKQATQANGPPQ